MVDPLGSNAVEDQLPNRRSQSAGEGEPKEAEMELEWLGEPQDGGGN